jgi:Fic family protein
LPKLTLLPVDDSATSDLCDELDSWRERLDSKGALLRIWQGRLRRDLEAAAVAASTSMEGIPVTVDEVRRILAGDQPVEVSAANRDLVEGYRDAMGFVLRRADDPSFRWDRELLVGLHDRVLGGNWGAGAGRFRSDTRLVANSETGVTVYEPPGEDLVPALVDEMCERMNAGFAHAAVAAAWVHIATAAIHPFRDGNGRAARVLSSLAMYRGGFRRREFTSLEEWWGRHRNDYYSAFACLGGRFRREADVTPFVRIHVQAQVSQVRALDLRERVLRRVFTAMVNLVESAGLPTRVYNAVWDAFFGGTVGAGYYRSIADVSEATATNDLVRAAAAGFLKAHGERRGRRYTAGESLYERIGEELSIRVTGSDDGARVSIIAELTRRVAEGDRHRLRLADSPGPDSWLA